MGSGLRVKNLGLRVQELWFRVWDSGIMFMVYGLGFRV